MADIHLRLNGELKRLLKITAAHREETITDAITRMIWWYVDGTDQLLLDACEEALGADEMTPDLRALAGIALGRAEMHQQQGGGEEG